MTQIMKIPWLLIFFANITLHICAQCDFKPLKIGDKVPDVFFSGLKNYASSKAKLSDFKGKVIILDFWNKFCSSCIAGFPKMEKLQSEFSDSLQVLLVTNDTQRMFEELFQNSLIVKTTKLPFVIGDTILNQLFPHRAVPYHVWIDGNGIVKATVTAQSEATAQNVRAILSGNKISVPSFDAYEDFDSQKPLIVEGGGRLWNRLDYYTSIMRGIVGNNAFENSAVVDPITGQPIENSVKIQNTNPLGLFNYAFGLQPKIIVEGKHAEAFFSPSDRANLDIWRDTMAFSYESVYPKKSEEHVRTRMMQQALENYFSVRVTVERKELPCFIIFRTTNEDKVTSKGGPEVNEFVDGEWVIRNVMIDGLLKAIVSRSLRGTKNEPVVFDETGFEQIKMVDLNVKNDISNLKALQTELEKYGLGIRVEDRELSCLVIRDM